MILGVLLSFSFFSVIYAESYDEMKNVVTINSKSFERIVQNQKWLVIFYRKSCGHCVEFSPVFAKFAASVERWKWIVNVGAVDCEDENSYQVCISQNIDRVPTIKYFCDKDSSLKGKQLRAFSDVDLLRTQLAMELESDSLLLLPSEEINIKHLTVYSPNATQNALIILDYKSLLNSSMGSKIEPNMNEILVKQSEGIIIARGSLEEVKKKLDDLTGSNRIDEHNLTTVSNDSKIVTEFPPLLSPVYAADVYKSLSMLLQSDVSARNLISDEEISALKEFLHILHQLLPASQYYKEHLMNLITWLKDKSYFSSKDWTDFLKNSNFPIYDGPFIGCKGSKPIYRGYPCGLWTLFHVLTVQQYLLIKKDEYTSPDMVGHALNRFVPRFFSCTYCAFHFAVYTANLAKPNESLLPQNREQPDPADFTFNPQIVKRLSEPPKTPYDTVLWLNNLHNKVNKRLAGTPSEDPTAPKVIFPPVQYCPSCWSRVAESQMVLGATDMTKENLFQFLISHYRPSAWIWNNMPSEFINDTKNVIEYQAFTDLITIAVISVVLTILAALILLIGLRFLCRRGLRFRRSGATGGFYTSGQTV